MHTWIAMCTFALLCTVSLHGVAEKSQPTRAGRSATVQREPRATDTTRAERRRQPIARPDVFRADRTGPAIVRPERPARPPGPPDAPAAVRPRLDGRFPGAVEAGRLVRPAVEPATPPARDDGSISPGRVVDGIDRATRPAADALKDTPPLSVPAFKTQRAEIAHARTMVQSPGSQSKLSVQQHRSLQAATDTLERANAVFEARAPAMTPRQQALAAVQVEAATTQILSATSAANANQSHAIEAGAMIATDAESFARLLPSGPRKLKVVVRPAAGKAPAPMAVYVLPLGLVTYGPSTDETKLRNLISVLMFAQPTSPSVGEVEPGVKYAVWVGPRHSVDLMARLVKNGAVQRYIPVDASSASLADVFFDEADQIREP